MTPLITEALSRDHDRRGFSCGVDALDRYLKERAFQDIDRRVAGCFVALTESRAIAGYYTLGATSVALDGLPASTAKRLPRYQGVPAMLIGRLAVHVDSRGRGLGGSLIMDASLRTDRLGIGAFALIVDAKDDNALSFYQAHQFALLAGETRRLFLPVATALAALK